MPLDGQGQLPTRADSAVFARKQPRVVCVMCMVTLQVPFRYYTYRGRNVMPIAPFTYSFIGGWFNHYYTKVRRDRRVSVRVSAQVRLQV
jgi:hypothetical protein